MRKADGTTGVLETGFLAEPLKSAPPGNRRLANQNGSFFMQNLVMETDPQFSPPRSSLTLPRMHENIGRASVFRHFQCRICCKNQYKRHIGGFVYLDPTRRICYGKTSKISCRSSRTLQVRPAVCRKNETNDMSQKSSAPPVFSVYRPGYIVKTNTNDVSIIDIRWLTKGTYCKNLYFWCR